MGDESKVKMHYVRMGKTGLKVSKLGFGAWATFGNQVDVAQAKKIIKQCFDAGVNFFDNAEVYESGKAEEIMGQAFKELGIPRKDYCLTTKLFWGPGKGPNDVGLNRKHIIEGTKIIIKTSLSAHDPDPRTMPLYMHILAITTVNQKVIYAHRSDHTTPMEETVRAFNYVIDQGWAMYWGTSEWETAQIQEAFGVADRLGLIPPSVEQPQYNMFTRKKVEQDFVPLFESAHGLGTTTWSPLAYGLLTGKYSKGNIPEGSRLASEKYKGLKESTLVDEKLDKVDKLKKVAEEIGATLPQLALAWCAKNDHVSVVLMGATKEHQISDNLASLNFLDKLTPEVMSKIDEIFGNKPSGLPTYH